MSRKQKRIPWPMLVTGLVLLSALDFISGRPQRVISSNTNTPLGTSPRVGTAPVLLPEQSGEGLVIAIRPDGFVPSNIELTKGRYIFIVQNHSGIRDLTFRLDRDTGERIYEVRSQKPRWKNAFDLQPGSYVLSIVDHPKWLCTIRVKPH